MELSPQEKIYFHSPNVISLDECKALYIALSAILQVMSTMPEDQKAILENHVKFYKSCIDSYTEMMERVH